MNDETPSLKPRGRVTLHDVARAAGVSKSTVSRMLDERLPQKETPKVQHVRKVARELGYVRDVSAASLRRGSTGIVGVIVPRLTDTVMAMFYEELSQAAAKTGKFTIVATTDDNPEASLKAAEALIHRGVDGLILTTAQEGDDMAKSLQDRGVPCVLALRHNGASLAAVGDDEMGGYLATRHLLDLGHRRIGIIAGPDYATSASGRVKGYRRAMAEAAATINPAWVIPSSFSIESGEAAAESLLKLPNYPTAIFAVNDNTAIGALSAIARAGLSVPRDISLVGYNDIPIVSRLPVPLTTVRVPFDRIAEISLQLLFNEMEASSANIRTVVPTLIPRESTSRPARR